MKKYDITIERKQFCTPNFYEQHLSINRLNEMYIHDGVALEVEDGIVARMIVEV